MLKINSKFIAQIQSANSLESLFPLVQNAIELEHATIPPYLTAMFSFTPGKNLEIRKVINSVVVEEMMHMTIAANILNAIGGKPQINNSKFVPEYPGPLPMGIGEGLIVGLSKYSKEVVLDVFMEIEEPEKNLGIKPKAFVAIPEYHTIGEFYDALKQKIDKLADDLLPGNVEKQVTSSYFDSKQLFKIVTKQDAMNAIDVIVEQGEGTTTSPLNQEGEIAHYYRFQELYYGKRLKVDPSQPSGYSYSGKPFPYDESAVLPIFPNTKASMLKPGTEERRRIDEFNASYASLLNGLHRTFNGEPDYLNNTIGLMFDIKLRAEKLCNTPFPNKPGYNIGPSFEFIDKS